VFRAVVVTIFPHAQVMAFLDRFAFRNPKKRNVVHKEALQEAVRSGGKHKPVKSSSTTTSLGAEQTQEELEAEAAAAYAEMAGEGDKFANVKKGLLRGLSKMQPRTAKRGRVAVDAPANTQDFAQLQPDRVRDEDVGFRVRCTLALCMCHPCRGAHVGRCLSTCS
jgi:hypothetical protein